MSDERLKGKSGLFMGKINRHMQPFSMRSYPYFILCLESKGMKKAFVPSV